MKLRWAYWPHSTGWPGLVSPPSFSHVLKHNNAEQPLPSVVLEFDRDTLDFIPSDRAPGGKVSDDTILNAVFHAGGSIRGPDLVNGLIEGCGAGERSVRERIRSLVKEGRLVPFIAEADKATRAKSYRLADSEGDE